MELTLPVVTSAAFLDSLNPCAISVLLLTIGFLLSIQRSRSQILKAGLSYVTGIFVTYILIGLGTLSVLSFFGIPQGLSKFGSLILISTSAINLLGVFFPKFPIKLVIPESAKPSIAKNLQKATIPAVFIMGVLVGLYEFPCTGGPYLMILSLLHDTATYTQGFLYLLYYNIIFVSPLVTILLLTSSPKILETIESQRKHHAKRLDIITNVLMLVLGLIIFFN